MTSNRRKNLGRFVRYDPKPKKGKVTPVENPVPEVEAEAETGLLFEMQYGLDIALNQKFMFFLFTLPNGEEHILGFDKEHVIEIRDMLNEYLSWTMEN